MRSKVRAYSHQGHGPRAEQQGYISATSDSTPSVAKGSRSIHSGHHDAFLRPRRSVRCRFSQGTFARTRGNGQDAPFATFLDRVSRGYRAAYRVRTFAVGDEISRKTARPFIPPVPSLAAGPTGKARGAGDPDANPTIIPVGPASWTDGAEVADRRCSGFIDGSGLDMIEGAGFGGGA